MLLVPVTILGVWLKLVRIRAFYPGSSLFDVAAKTSSDLAFGLAWLLLWLVACQLARGALRVVLFYLAHVATLVVNLVIVVNHEYMMRTGGPVTWDYFVTVFEQFGEYAEVLATQATAESTALLIGVAIGGLSISLISLTMNLSTNPWAISEIAFWLVPASLTMKKSLKLYQ